MPTTQHLLLLQLFCYLTTTSTALLKDITVSWINKDDNGGYRTDIIKDVDILKNASYVSVKQQQVRVLEEGGFFDLPFLEYVTLIENGIEDLQPGCFKNVSNLATLYLDNNRIAEIKEGVFNGLNLLFLSLSNNRITIIDTMAFDNMPHLYELDLSFNDINYIDNSWYYNTANLTIIHLNSNNITELPALTFKNIQRRVVRGNETRDFSFDLSHNHIKTIHPKAFKGFKEIGSMLLNDNEISELHEDVFESFRYIGMLSLRNNNLRTLPDKILETGFKAVNGTILLAVNKWNCDFRLKFKKWVEENGKNYDLVGDWWCYDKHSIY